MGGHFVAVAANVPVRCAEIGGGAPYSIAIAVGVTGEQIAGWLEIRRTTQNARLVEGTSASRDIRPIDEIAEPFASSIGTTHDIGRARHAGWLAYVNRCWCVGGRR
jgi:hypothetical protein